MLRIQRSLEDVVFAFCLVGDLPQENTHRVITEFTPLAVLALVLGHNLGLGRRVSLLVEANEGRAELVVGRIAGRTEQPDVAHLIKVCRCLSQGPLNFLFAYDLLGILLLHVPPQLRSGHCPGGQCSFRLCKEIISVPLPGVGDTLIAGACIRLTSCDDLIPVLLPPEVELGRDVWEPSLKVQIGRVLQFHHLSVLVQRGQLSRHL
mmetsp:Transcript_16125/g.35433  ORF Transcript_16125/g.35433 Transcript_16125/m.35433 type:complete len:206 (+) Transcript_16125:61-678(+)